LVDGNCRLVRGEFSIKDNVSTGDGVYAAHTKNLNAYSIGISACCMAGAVENPFNPGKYPLGGDQWDMLARVAADLCRTYNIPVSPTTVLQHGEVQDNLGVAQSGKWDICRLPWETWDKDKVGDDFRSRVEAYLAVG
jgi:N-acetyl-anhydromuramyl-L-alanine amidase AmpD